MGKLNESDRERVDRAFEIGVSRFTEDDLNKVKDDAVIAESKSRYLGKQFESFRVMWALLQDYWSGDYTSVPWKFIASIGFAMAYLVSPIDIIPDFLPVLGFVDDAAVFALVVSAFQSELDEYKKWKEDQKR